MTWTKEVVQKHAQHAAAVELYTIPFYTTVMTSVIDKDSDAYNIIRGVLIEEMMHLQLAANLCLALDTIPAFQIPSYVLPVPFLNPGAQLNADMGPLDNRSLSAMLAIETPEETLGNRDITPNDNMSPKYPYSSIDEMYHALLYGVENVGISQFTWNTRNQQQHWAVQGYPQIIRNVEEAKQVVAAIGAQGEGSHLPDNIQPPYNPTQFCVPSQYQMNNAEPFGAPGSPYRANPVAYKEYSHFGRFLKIQQDGIPPVYRGRIDPNHPINQDLRRKFTVMVASLNTLWTLDTGSIQTPVQLWSEAVKLMREVAELSRKAWQHGVIPDWSF